LRETRLSEGDHRTMWATPLVFQGKTEEARQQAGQARAAYTDGPEVSYPLFNLGFLYL